MFDFFKKPDYSKVKFPETKPMWNVPVEPIEQEEPAKIFYRVGVTDSNRVSLQVGYSELTMTRLGVQNLIDQLEVFKNQLEEEE